MKKYQTPLTELLPYEVEYKLMDASLVDEWSTGGGDDLTF